MEYVLAASNHCRARGSVLTGTVKVMFLEEYGSSGKQLSLSPEPESISDAARGIVREDKKEYETAKSRAKAFLK